MNNKPNVNIAEMQEEYTFPHMLPSEVCRKKIKEIDMIIKPRKIVFWIALAAYILFMTLTTTFAIIESKPQFGLGTWDETLEQFVRKEPNYTGTIICAVLLGCTIIAGIINLVIASRQSKGYNTYKYTIEVNSQYSDFINQGYEKKEAYKLTLEWLDRQANSAAVRSVATTNAMIAMSNISHLNMH